MKKLLKPTRAERELIQANRLNSDNWTIERKNHLEIVIVHRSSGKKRTLKR